MKEGERWIHRICKACVWVLLFVPVLVSISFLGQFVGIPSKWAALGALFFWAALAWISDLRKGGAASLVIVLIATVGYFSQRPSHERDWMPEIARLPSFELKGEKLHARDLRNFDWSSSKTFEENWTTGTYDLSHIEGVDVFVVPLGDSDLAAHVMLSFQFEDGQHLAVSVETRPEVGESYSLVGGAARQLELIYLFGTEQDLLGLRILHRGNRVYRFPLEAEKVFAKELLLELCASANDLQANPKFYATLRHNCTTTLLRHVNRLREEPFGIYKEIIFPAQLGKLLYRLGYLDTEHEWQEAKERFRVDERVRNTKDLTDFSKTLRGID